LSSKQNIIIIIKVIPPRTKSNLINLILGANSLPLVLCTVAKIFCNVPSVPNTLLISILSPYLCILIPIYHIPVINFSSIRHIYKNSMILICLINYLFHEFHFVAAITKSYTFHLYLEIFHNAIALFNFINIFLEKIEVNELFHHS
jgi:hypothetical protein